MNKYFLIFAIAMLNTVPTFAERAETVIQQQVTAKSATASPHFLGSGEKPSLLNIPDTDINVGGTTNGAYQNGTVYHLPIPLTAMQLHWEAVDSGYVARVKLSANQAKELRYHLVFNQSIPAIQFRVKGNNDKGVSEVIDHTSIHDNNIWLPVTAGNQADLEIYVDKTTPPNATLSIDEVAIIVNDLSDTGLREILAKSLGKAQNKELDVACKAGSPQYSAIQQVASATALMTFVAKGGTYVCTGTLLSDKKGSKTPWFATANHCLPNQTVANTANFKWFYQATACNSSVTDSRSTVTGGGAQLLWTDVTLEGAFLKLNVQPPNGVAFIGWDSNIKANDEVWGIHHPKSDHTMVSHGKVSALLQTVYESGTMTPHIVNKVLYSEGGTEGGSSGSGLFSIENGSAYWKGTLFGGPQNYQIAAYSNFSSYYPKIKHWLDGSSETVDNVDIENFYRQYPTYFGIKSAGNYICYTAYTCQNFINGKTIGLHNTTKALYWFDGSKWNQYR